MSIGNIRVRWSYAGHHLLPPGIVQSIVGLGKDVVPSVLDAHGVIVRVGTLVAGMSVDVCPEVG